MQTDRSIVVTLASRLFADEVAALQARIGSVLPLRDVHRHQSLTAVGLDSVCGRDAPADYVKASAYLSRCALAVLDEVGVDTLFFTRIDPGETYSLKNVYRPFFQWDSQSELAVVPPYFGREEATVRLESNGFDIVFPLVLPADLAQTALQKVLMYNMYMRVYRGDPFAVNIDAVRLICGNVAYMGRTYPLDVNETDPRGALASLDSLSLYLSIMTALLPRATLRLTGILMRHDQHRLLEVFRGIIPPEIVAIDNDELNIQDDAARMDAFLTYLQALAPVFNLGARLKLAAYSTDTLTGTCWLAVS